MQVEHLNLRSDQEIGQEAQKTDKRPIEKPENPVQFVLQYTDEKKINNAHQQTQRVENSVDTTTSPESIRKARSVVISLVQAHKRD
jgi:hypothetical protein